jgi:hypothetical protein
MAFIDDFTICRQHFTASRRPREFTRSLQRGRPQTGEQTSVLVNPAEVTRESFHIARAVDQPIFIMLADRTSRI